MASQNVLIADTIRRQISGTDKWCLAACGAREYVALDNNSDRRGGIQFRVTIKPRTYHKIVIELTHMDSYRVQLFKISWKTYEATVEREAECYADELAQTVYDFCNK